VTIPGIVLHPSVQTQLQDFITEPAHAVLFSGPLGMGKTHIARATATELLDKNAASLENQAYLTEIAPVKDSITIEQVRTLTKFFRLSVPGKARIKRVAIIQEAETMGREAQNALLKLLEEPPEGSVLILTSSYPEQLLPTIRSRTRIVMLAVPDTAALIEYFTALQYDETTVRRTLLRTGSNVAEAAHLLATDSSTPDDALDQVKQVLSGNAYDRMLLVDALAKQKDRANAFVATLAATAVASLQTAAVKNPAAITRWQTVLEAADTAGTALERNGNTKLVLTELMLNL
jgi:DNA polymerase III delta prime subunit